MKCSAKCQNEMQTVAGTVKSFNGVHNVSDTGTDWAIFVLQVNFNVTKNSRSVNYKHLECT